MVDVGRRHKVQQCSKKIGKPDYYRAPRSISHPENKNAGLLAQASSGLKTKDLGFSKAFGRASR